VNARWIRTRRLRNWPRSRSSLRAARIDRAGNEGRTRSTRLFPRTGVHFA
jgi:hypothetical protein